MLEKLLRINAAYDGAYQGAEPFQIVSRLAEECGELAAQVNHFEDTGYKREKHGEPDRGALTAEVVDVLRCALQVASYYGVVGELELVTDRTLAELEERDWLRQGE